MESNYTSFLMQCDRQLSIMNTLWHQPVTLISPYLQSFPNLFIESDRDRIRVLAEEAFSQRRILACEETFRTITPETSVSICLMAMGDKLLIHGLDTAVLSPEFPVAILQELVHRFMKVVHLSDKELFTETTRWSAASSNKSKS